uniref:Uncharacterized protein n=1 Tax=Megaselia scalaris TaxID=36166 RepID=T1GM06_MEGSC
MLPWLVFEGISSLALTGTMLCMFLTEVRQIFNSYMMIAFGFSITNVFMCPLEVYLWIKYWNIFREIKFSKSIEEKVVNFYNIERGALTF